MVVPPLSERALFGGAITALLPTRLIDASELRQVPDTQEVFLDPASDVSIIFEILQRVAPDDAADAARFHFDALAHDNAAIAADVRAVALPPAPFFDASETPRPVALTGSQRVAKFNSAAPDTVRILMGLFRVQRPGVAIDFVVTCNVPAEPGIPDAQAEARTDALYESAEAEFEGVLRTLRIVDFGLFA